MKTIELNLIPADEVPKVERGKRKPGEWDTILESISPDMAAEILNRKDASPIRAVLRRRQKEGNFLNYFVTQREGKIYVINPKEPEE